jgi:hypothetical protein
MMAPAMMMTGKIELVAKANLQDFARTGNRFNLAFKHPSAHRDHD